jgi:hypothetical protein
VNQEMMSFTGKTRNTVIKAMDEMVNKGMAESVSKSSWLRSRVNPAKIAEEIGALQHANNRRRQYREKRQANKQRKLNYLKRRQVKHG